MKQAGAFEGGWEGLRGHMCMACCGPAWLHMATCPQSFSSEISSIVVGTIETALLGVAVGTAMGIFNRWVLGQPHSPSQPGHSPQPCRVTAAVSSPQLHVQPPPCCCCMRRYLFIWLQYRNMPSMVPPLPLALLPHLPCTRGPPPWATASWAPCRVPHCRWRWPFPWQAPTSRTSSCRQGMSGGRARGRGREQGQGAGKMHGLAGGKHSSGHALNRLSRCGALALAAWAWWPTACMAVPRW